MNAIIWVGFILLILGLLALDLGVFHRKAKAILAADALAWTGVWIAVALAFNLLVYFLYEQNWVGLGLAFPEHVDGQTAALQFFTGYLLEKSLSLDNIFVIALIFSYFNVPLAYQHRVLFWGVLGALVLRGLMIAMGATLIHTFSWMIYIFGAILILTAVKMLIARHDNLEPDKNLLIRLARRYFPVTEGFREDRFFVRDGVKLAITPLFLVLALIESSDLLFAVDSIPAIFAVTTDPFLVYTSNVFAILGLRSLYFAIAPLIARFRYLKMSLVFLMAYVGVKMLLSHHYPIPIPISLSVISVIIGVGVLASIYAAHRDTAPLVSPVADHLDALIQLTIRSSRKILVLIVGSTLLVIGAAMIILPGPAVVVIPVSLLILATEFLWARRLLAKMRQQTDTIIAELRSKIDSK